MAGEWVLVRGGRGKDKICKIHKIYGKRGVGEGKIGRSKICKTEGGNMRGDKIGG